MFNAIRKAVLRLLPFRPPAGGYRYTIGGRRYVQRPLVLLQIEQLTAFLATIQLQPGLNVVGIVAALGDRLADALAIVLIPADVEDIDQKDLPEISAQLRHSVDITTAVQVVEDFLSCNPLGSVFERFSGAIGKYGALLVTTGSVSSSASSPTAT